MNNIKNNTKHYRNTPRAARLLHMALPQEPAPTLKNSGWFSSIRISGSRMNDHDTFEEAGLAGCVYDLHDENLFTIDQVLSLMNTLECVWVMEGVADDIIHYRFSIHIEGPEGDWLLPIHEVPFNRIINVINLCSFWYEELVAEKEEVRQLESTADSVIAQVLPLLGMEERQHLCLAWSMASAEIHSKFLTL